MLAASTRIDLLTARLWQAEVRTKAATCAASITPAPNFPERAERLRRREENR